MTSVPSYQVARHSIQHAPGASHLYRNPCAREPHFTLFMMPTTICPACRLLQEAGAQPVRHRIHVCRDGNLLTITDATDLHRAGPPLFARHVRDFPKHSLFRLLSEPPADQPGARFQSASGMVMLGLHDRSWILRVVRWSSHDRPMNGQVYQAVEIKN